MPVFILTVDFNRYFKNVFIKYLIAKSKYLEVNGQGVEHEL